MREEDEVRRAGRAAATGGAYQAMSDGGAEAAADATTAAPVGPSGGIKDGLAQAQPQHPWHTAPWQAARSALGPRGALGALGGVVAVVGVAVGAVLVLSGGDDPPSDSALETDGGLGGDKDRTPGGGDKEGEEDDTSSSSASSTTAPGDTTTTTPGATSTTGGETPVGVPVTTPDGSTVTVTTPDGETVPVTNPPATTSTTPSGTVTTQSTVPPTPPVPPRITSFTRELVPNHPCKSPAVGVHFSWTSNGVTATLESKSGALFTGLKGNGQRTTCSLRAESWTLTVTATNGTSSSSTISST